MEILYGKNFMDRCVYTNHPHYLIAHRPGCEAHCDELRPHLPFVYRSAVNISVAVKPEGNLTGDYFATAAGIHNLLTPPPVSNSSSSSGSRLLSPGHFSNISISYASRPAPSSAPHPTSTAPSALALRGPLVRFGKATLERLTVGDKLISEYLVDEL